MATKLHQVIAVEKGIKSRVYKLVTELYKSIQKPALFDGFAKTFEKTDEEGEELPDEKKLVQLNAEQVLQDIAESMTEHFDVVAAKDHANCEAKADVVVGGVTILKAVPATHLLFLEKQVTDLNTAIEHLPVLDPAYDWTEDPATSLFKSTAQRTTRTKKVQKPIVLYDATDNHPAQTQLITEDQVVGHWVTVKHSGAVTAARKKELQKRVQALLKAIKFAREEANSVEAPAKSVGEAVFGYLLG